MIKDLSCLAWGMLGTVILGLEERAIGDELVASL